MDTPTKEKIKRVLMIALLILVLLIASCTGCDLYNKQYSSDYNVKQATEALDELDQLLAAKEAGEEVDEDRIAQLTSQIVEYTEAAIEIAEENSNPEELQDILEEISELQTSSAETFSEALEVVEGEGVAEIVSDAITTTTDEQTQVADAIGETETALEAGEGTVEVDIGTTADEQAAEEAPGDGTTTEEQAAGETADEEAPGDGTTTEEQAAGETAAGEVFAGEAAVTASGLPETASPQAHENAENDPGNNK